MNELQLCLGYFQAHLSWQLASPLLYTYNEVATKKIYLPPSTLSATPEV